MTFPQQLLWLFFSFRGRCGRATSLLASLLLFVTQFFLLWRFLVALPLPSEGPIDPYLLDFSANGWGQMFMAFSFVKAWCNIAIAVKRLHDINVSGLFAAATIFFDIGVILVLALFRGTPGPNKYGPGPDQPV